MIIPRVPDELRQPCEGPKPKAQTRAQLARLLVDYDEALGCANGRIGAIDQILTSAEAGAQ